MNGQPAVSEPSIAVPSLYSSRIQINKRERTSILKHFSSQANSMQEGDDHETH